MTLSRSSRFPFLCALCMLSAPWLSLPATPTQLPPSPARAAIEQNRIGVGYMNQYAFKAAAAAFQKALGEDPSFNLARVNLGIALFYDQNLDGAMAVLREAEKNEPRNPYAQFVLGLAHRNRGEVENAIERFLKVANTDERCAAAHYNLGLLYSHQRRDAEAEAEFRRALALDPDYGAAMYNLGGLLVKSGRADEGTRILERFRALSEKDRPSSGMGSGPQYGKMGRYTVAREYQPPPASPCDPVVP